MQTTHLYVIMTNNIEGINMKINSYLYKNNLLHKKNLNIEALYDKTNEKIVFKEENFEIEIVFLTPGIKYTRKTLEYTFKLEVSNNTTASLELKNYQQTLPLKVTNDSYIKEDNKITITYCLETEDNILNKIVIESDEL